MKRTKLVVFITVLLISGITAVFTYATQTFSSGSSMIMVTNPPYTSKTWEFYGPSLVNVYFENISNYTVFVSVDCVNTSTGTEYYTLLPHEMTSTMSYRTMVVVDPNRNPWGFTIQVSNLAQIVGHAYWN